jgi:hypothetical protein
MFVDRSGPPEDNTYHGGAFTFLVAYAFILGCLFHYFLRLPTLINVAAR